MTVAELFALLDAVMPGKAFKGLAPAGTPEPYVVYSRPWEQPDNTLCGYAYREEVHYQIDSYAKTSAEAVANLKAVKAALRASPDPPNVENEQDLYETDTRLHRSMMTITTATEGV
ncbi:uncharacterized protein DUF3168 [Paraburkholderia sp. BL8N3]|nr:DUF3168 domain-containing protein [Paraburkholderia sp. BL8N3]TCK37975.1 uncharacterized protein DUF3168 [Paraburkholderia sp. BL8N3]